MRFFHLFLLVSIIFASSANASIGDELNSLIDKFFGSGQTPSTEDIWQTQNTETTLEDPKNTLETQIPEDITNLREKIISEETSLSEFENAIREEESKLWDIQNQSAGFENQVFLLDQQININAKKVEKYQKLEENWKNELNSITKEKSETKAEFRLAEEAYKNFMEKKYIRDQIFGFSGEISIWKWLFSDRSVSQIMEDRNKGNAVAQEKKSQLSRLNKLKQALEVQEKKAAMLYSRLSFLKRQLASEKMILQNMADGKSKLLSELSETEATSAYTLEQARVAQADSTIYLQNLRQKLQEVQEKNLTQENIDSLASTTESAPKSLFEWPLKIPIKIQAKFHDPEYKKEFGKEHTAIDIFASQGTTVYAPLEGKVEKVASNGFGYSYLILKHKDNFYTVYGHISQILVKEGDFVELGQAIAASGGTPGTPGAGFFTSGPHLHFEVFKDGKFLDPINFLPKIAESE